MPSRKWLLLIVPGFLAVANANTILPSYEWTGDPTAVNSSESPGTFTRASGINLGMSIEGSCGSTLGDCEMDFTWSRPFTVTSAGTFVLEGSLGESFFALNCDPACGLEATFTVTGPLQLKGSKSKTNDSESRLITLGVGDYILSEEFVGSIEASGELTADLNGIFLLVPTPEPRWGFVAGVGLLLGGLWLKRRRTA